MARKQAYVVYIMCVYFSSPSPIFMNCLKKKNLMYLLFLLCRHFLLLARHVLGLFDAGDAVVSSRRPSIAVGGGRRASGVHGPGAVGGGGGAGVGGGHRGSGVPGLGVVTATNTRRMSRAGLANLDSSTYILPPLIINLNWFYSQMHDLKLSHVLRELRWCKWK